MDGMDGQPDLALTGADFDPDSDFDGKTERRKPTNALFGRATRAAHAVVGTYGRIVGT
jgi:hypothetical protein